VTPEFVNSFLFSAIKLAILLSAPVLLFGLVAGVLVSMFQAATQINEMTLVFIPKMAAVVVAMLIFFPWMMQLIVGFTRHLINNIPYYIR